MKIKLIHFAFLFLISLFGSFAQQISVEVKGIKSDKVFLSSLHGEKTKLVDSLINFSGNIISFRLHKNYSDGLYRISFSQNKNIDLVYDGRDITLKTDANNLLDSMKVILSESNRLFYSFIKLSRQYKTKTELLQLMLARFPKDDKYYNETKKRLNELQNEYIKFVNITAQKEPQSFIARYIRSAQLLVVDFEIPIDKQLEHLKMHALDNINFKDVSLINSDLFTNKTIEYLTYYRNPQLPKELFEKEFCVAVDSILNKAKVHQLVYQHITEYLIDGFKKFGFDNVLDYIVDNYVIKDDLCLDVKTEGMIKRRIDQAKYLKIGSTVPEIISKDVNGKEIRLSQINSEKVLILFYASWCPHCKELLPKLNELLKKTSENKITVLAISLDSKKEDWINFVNDNCSAFINVSDFKGWEGKASSDYFMYATPTMFVVDKDKKIISKPMTFEEVKNYFD